MTARDETAVLAMADRAARRQSRRPSCKENLLWVRRVEPLEDRRVDVLTCTRTYTAPWMLAHGGSRSPAPVRLARVGRPAVASTRIPGHHWSRPLGRYTPGVTASTAAVQRHGLDPHGAGGPHAAPRPVPLSAGSSRRAAWEGIRLIVLAVV